MNVGLAVLPERAACICEVPLSEQLERPHPPIPTLPLPLPLSLNYPYLPYSTLYPPYPTFTLSLPYLSLTLPLPSSSPYPLTLLPSLPPPPQHTGDVLPFHLFRLLLHTVYCNMRDWQRTVHGKKTSFRTR